MPGRHTGREGGTEVHGNSENSGVWQGGQMGKVEELWAGEIGKQGEEEEGKLQQSLGWVWAEEGPPPWSCPGEGWRGEEGVGKS